MGVIVVVAGGVAAVLYIESVFVYFLCLSACQIAFALLGDYIGDVAVFRLEVVVHCFCFIRCPVVFEYGSAEEVADGVYAAHCIDGVVVEIHLDLFGIKFDVAIADFAVAIHECGVAPDEHH